MTREELLEAATDCATAARQAAGRLTDREAAAEMYARAGMLFARVAELTEPLPRPPVSDQIMGGPPTHPVVRFGRVVQDTPDAVA